MTQGVDAKNSKTKISPGVIVVAAILILSSLFRLLTLMGDYNWYFYIFNYMPKWMILLRYEFSLAQRMVCIVVGMGILSRNDFFRKAALALSYFTIATLPWKHSCQAFKNHAEYLNQNGAWLRAGISGLDFSSFAWAAWIGQCVLDIMFWGFIIYFFTRPSVKAQFTSGCRFN